MINTVSKGSFIYVIGEKPLTVKEIKLVSYLLFSILALKPVLLKNLLDHGITLRFI